MALKIITDFAEPDAYKRYGIGMAYSRYREAALADALAPADIMALGVSGRPEALALLEKMHNHSGLQKWRNNVTDAISTNVKMRSLGPLKLFNQAEKN